MMIIETINVLETFNLVSKLQHVFATTICAIPHPFWQCQHWLCLEQFMPISFSIRVVGFVFLVLHVLKTCHFIPLQNFIINLPS